MKIYQKMPGTGVQSKPLPLEARRTTREYITPDNDSAVAFGPSGQAHGRPFVDCPLAGDYNT